MSFWWTPSINELEFYYNNYLKKRLQKEIRSYAKKEQTSTSFELTKVKDTATKYASYNVNSMTQRDLVFDSKDCLYA